MTDLDTRITQRARKLWQEAGSPAGGIDGYLDQASELIAIEDNHEQAMRPLRPSERTPDAEVPLEPGELGPNGEPIEPLIAVENAGEFPTMTDQGEEQTAPKRGR